MNALSSLLSLQSLPGHEIHMALEILAYFIGARIYFYYSGKNPTSRPATLNDRLSLLVGAIFGALIGSKLLHIAEHLPYLLSFGTPELWLGGKSVLGGFIGGTLGVELAKTNIGWTTSTGDAWVPALVVGLCIGRLGCQLSGVWDQTYGIETTLPWGWNYGDRVLRHPTGLYEILAVIVVFTSIRSQWKEHVGARFAAFLGFYCLIRFGVEFLKPPFGPVAEGSLPTELFGPFSPIQWCALIGLLGYGWLFKHRVSKRQVIA